MKKLTSVVSVALLVLGLGALASGQTAAPKKSKIPASLKSQAKIPVEDARATASKKVPGEIKEEELEKENGKLVYSFDIQAPGQKDITEVQVSAMDGTVVSVEKENPASEAKENKQDQAKHSTTPKP
jgi:uncharacterized membrane protein YkoI